MAGKVKGSEVDFDRKKFDFFLYWAIHSSKAFLYGKIGVLSIKIVHTNNKN